MLMFSVQLLQLSAHNAAEIMTSVSVNAETYFSSLEADDDTCNLSPRAYVSPELKDGSVLNDAVEFLEDEGVFHLLSHGKPGHLFLDGEWKNTTQIADWLQENNYLSHHSHLNIYGCNFAQSETGRAAVEYLKAALGVSVAASDDVTGVDGDWDLEVGSAISSVSVLDYEYSLQTCDCTEYLYLNEPITSNPALGRVHKYAVAADGTLTEVGNPWLEGSDLPAPHGLGVDLNGFLYISQRYQAGDIRRLNCAGEVLPEADFAIPIQGASNIFSIGNTLIVQETNVPGLTLYDVCSQSAIDTICFNGPQLDSDWGLYIDENENIYVASGAEDDAIYRFTLAEAASGCITPLAEGTPGNPLFNPAATNSNNFEAMGITADGDGNIFVIGGTSYGTNGILYKFDPSGNAVDNTGILPNNPVGLIWVETCDCIYVSGNTITNDCVAIYDTDLNYQGTGVGPGTSTLQVGKAVGKSKECCPTDPGPVAYNETVCSSGQGEQFFLQDFVDCGDGRICEGQWSVETPNANQIFNDCDLSITVNGSGCATYVLEKTTPATGNQQCGAFRIELEICVEVPAATATLTAAPATCSGPIAQNDGSVTLTAVTNATHFGVSNLNAGTYDGPTTIASATAITLPQTVQSNIPNTGGSYIVRIFNGSDDCFVDKTVTVAANPCPNCTLTATPTAASQPGGNGSYDLTVTLDYTNSPGGVITVTLGTGEMQASAPTTVGSSGQATVTFTGLANTGDNNISVDASFDGLTSCGDSETYDEPCFLEITNTAVTDNCAADGTYDVSVTYTVYNAPGNLTASIGGASATVIYNPGDDEVGGSVTVSGVACSNIVGGSATVTLDLGGGCSDTDLITPPVLPASLGDMVWEDVNYNGIQDGGEPGVEGVTVTLFTCVGGVKDQPVLVA